MALLGIARIDDLYANKPGAVPLAEGDSDFAAVAAVADLLKAFTRRNSDVFAVDVPGPGQSAYGKFGPKMKGAVSAFQKQYAVPVSGKVDSTTLQLLAKAVPPSPRMTPSYVALALDLSLTPMTPIVSLVSLFETKRRFTARAGNKDRQGTSFGIIQWAQKQGRLVELIEAFFAPTPENLEAMVIATGIVGPKEAHDLLAHLRKPGGGVNEQGQSTDPRFDLNAAPWPARFQRLGLSPVLQKIQVRLALAAFAASHRRLLEIPRLSEAVKSQRAVGFLMDLVNHHGDGGARSLIDKVFHPDQSLDEKKLLADLRDESIAHIRKKHPKDEKLLAATTERRDFFRATGLLSDQPF